MGAGIYKKNQGYYTRVCSAVALATIVLMGAIWLWDLLGGVRIGTLEPVYIQATGAFLVTALFGIFGYYLIGRKPKVVDFMIATEGEMKKVNWSSRREILGSTWVVITCATGVVEGSRPCSTTLVIRSRSVKIPASVSWSRTATAPTWFLTIAETASFTVADFDTWVGGV